MWTVTIKVKTIVHNCSQLTSRQKITSHGNAKYHASLSPLYRSAREAACLEQKENQNWYLFCHTSVITIVVTYWMYSYSSAL